MTKCEHVTSSSDDVTIGSLLASIPKPKESNANSIPIKVFLLLATTLPPLTLIIDPIEQLIGGDRTSPTQTNLPLSWV